MANTARTQSDGGIEVDVVVLGLLSLAVHARAPLADLRSMIYAFPTFCGGIGEALEAYGRGLSTVIDPGYQGFEVLDAVGALGGA